jgi:hypothetical protein
VRSQHIILLALLSLAFLGIASAQQRLDPDSDRTVNTWTPVAQRLDPDADVIVGSFSTPIYSKLNDGASPNDLTYTSEVFTNSVDGYCTDNFTVSLSDPPNTPVSGASTVVTVRSKVSTTSYSPTIQIYLYEGATDRGHTSATALTTSFANYTLTVSSGITNWNNLTVNVAYRTTGANGTQTTIYASWMKTAVTNTILYNMLNDGASAIDATYITATAGADPDGGANCNFAVGLSNPPNTPGSGTTTLTVRAKVDGTAYSPTISIYLYEGTTLRGSSTGNALTASFANYTLDVTSGIVNFNNLNARVTILAFGTPGGEPIEQCSWIKVDVPNVASTVKRGIVN